MKDSYPFFTVFAQFANVEGKIRAKAQRLQNLRHALGWILVWIIVCFGSVTTYGDTLILRNNQQVIGKILSITDDKVVIAVNDVPLELSRGDIVEIIRSEETQPTQPAQPAPAEPAPAPVLPATAGIPASTTSNFPLPIKKLEDVQATSSETPAATVRAPAPAVSTAVADATPMPLLPVVLPKGKAYQVIGTGVRFRKGPSQDYEMVDMLPGGSIVMEIEFTDNWLHAQTLNGQEGWIHPSFVRPLENIPCLVTANQLDIREVPDDLSRSLARLRKDDVVMKLEERMDWWFVLSVEMSAGWVNRHNLLPLKDKEIYQPNMKIASNEELGTPVLMERKPDQPGLQRITFVLRNDSLEESGKTNLIIFHKDLTLFSNPNLAYSSESIIARHRMDNAVAIVQMGLPEEAAVNFVGGDVLTMLGNHVPEGWSYSVVLPDASSLTFGFIVQNGPGRGTLILLQ